MWIWTQTEKLLLKTEDFVSTGDLKKNILLSSPVMSRWKVLVRRGHVLQLLFLQALNCFNTIAFLSEIYIDSQLMVKLG